MMRTPLALVVVTTVGLATAALLGVQHARAVAPQVDACQDDLGETTERFVKDGARTLKRCVERVLRCAVKSEVGEFAGRPVLEQNCRLDAQRYCTARFNTLDRRQETLTRRIDGSCGALSLDALTASQGGLGFAAHADACAALGYALTNVSDVLGCYAALVRTRVENAVGFVHPRACDLMTAAGLISRAPGLCPDREPPELVVTAPADGSATKETTPLIRVEYSDAGTGVVLESFALSLDGIAITDGNVVGADEATYQVAAPLAEGEHVIEVRIRDRAGNEGVALATFVVDLTPPIITVAYPADGTTISSATPTIRVDFSDALSGVNLSTYETSLDGVDVTAGAVVYEDYAVYVVGSPLTTGPHTAEGRIRDRAGNEATATSTFSVTVFRAIADCAPRNGNAPLQVTFRTRGEFTGGSIVRYRWDFQNDGAFDTSDAVPRDLNFTYQQSGTFTAVLEVLNNRGETATDACTIEVTGNAPTAIANASPSNGGVPLLVNLTCAGSDPDGSVVLYEWDFEGDGTFDFSTPSSGDTTHSYVTVGTFIAVCRVTDNDGFTAEARTTTTVIRPAPPGSPSVEASANPGSGNAPLQVSLNGSATDDGSIVLWEWDFDGDGTFDYSSTTSPATNFTYVNGGVFAATLRATDNDGLTGIDTVAVVTNISASLSVPDDTFDPSVGETAEVRTTISGGVPVRLVLKDRSGSVVRVLAEGFRAAGSYSDLWDGLGGAAQPLPQGAYYAVLEYQFAGQTRTVDLTNTTGGQRYSPSRNTLPSVFRPFEDDLLTINFNIPASQGASEILAFIGLFNVDTRFITLLERVPLGVGTHTIKWDGLDANGHFAVPPPGDAFLFGIFGFRLPDNAIFVQSAPLLSNVTVDPNLFDPSAADFLSSGQPTATVTYDLDKVADVELTVTNLTTALILRRINRLNVQPGAAHTIQWDGHADSGLFVDRGDYRLSLRAIDSAGGASLTRYALVRVFY